MSYVKFMGGVLIISFWPPSYSAKPGSDAISQVTQDEANTTLERLQGDIDLAVH